MRQNWGKRPLWAGFKKYPKRLIDFFDFSSMSMNRNRSFLRSMQRKCVTIIAHLGSLSSQLCGTFFWGVLWKTWHDFSASLRIKRVCMWAFYDERLECERYLKNWWVLALVSVNGIIPKWGANRCSGISTTYYGYEKGSWIEKSIDHHQKFF